MKRIQGVTAKLLFCAKEEFLEKGFQGASVRDIAKRAETSPRAVYTRFPDKEGLFRELVLPVAEEFLTIIKQGFESYAMQKFPLKYDMNTNQGVRELMEYVYGHFDEFKLIITCSQGTEYAYYIDTLASIDLEYTTINIEKTSVLTSDNNIKSSILLQKLLTKAFYTCLFEPVVNNLTKEEALFYVQKLRTFFTSGISGLA